MNKKKINLFHGIVIFCSTNTAKYTYRILLGGIAQLAAHLTEEQEVPGSIPGPITYFCGN